ncbi:MAG TPA: SDR family oxidoreductase [Vicinamibacterales bacterium]|nr:SDR family oxidoreductase [Vicinamibacterales bacterium]
MSEIAGRTILITGAASGIGRRLAQAASRDGAAVVLWDIDREGLDRIAGELRAHASLRVHAMTVDVASREAVCTAASRVRSTAGPVDILVNNAGVVSGRMLLDLRDDQIETAFAVNTLALYWTTRAFLPAMIERGRGHIVTMASAAGLVGVSRQTDYSASKHAAVGFDESLRYELRRIAPGVRTTVVCPFYVDTGLFDGVKSRFPRLLPILDESAVAERVMRAVRRNEPRVILPPLVRLMPIARALPVSVFDRLIDFFGVNVGMDEFRGRGDTLTATRRTTG